MVATDRTRELFADARTLYADALEMLEQDKIRNAAEKAWGATKRATDALVLARTGAEPRTSGRTFRAIRELRRQHPDVFQLSVRYGERQNVLHGKCFYDGMCEPEDEVIRDIRDTIGYIEEAETLAAKK